ncbi:hypothetical protein [Micromonospora sp. NBC_01813]|uniref:hypothetical protein n=1 Tax=Micromonospora sp. NBC_01813 TaxID=2975988 RepID=UPI002DD96BDA|nr:hypothetical protein [Micromonospora sp. NBC_01813]WSA12241.1 hypothetical protein OG958_16525 [Micromonospora sp. NBC_01813]
MRSSGPTRFALVLLGTAVGYLIGRRMRSGGGTTGSTTGSTTGGTTATGPLTATSDGDGRWWGRQPVPTVVGPPLGRSVGRPADEDFAADTVSGSSATTASHPYEVPPGRTTAKPAAPVGDPVVPTGAAGDDGPRPLRRRPDRPGTGV